jgi:hypothetical protein
LSLEVPSFYFGLGASKATLRVATIDFQKENPAIDYVKLKMNDRDIQLHGSWAMRPVLVLETKEPQPKTKLVFSRGEIEPGKAAGPKWRTEALSLQTLVFERESNSPDGPFLKNGRSEMHGEVYVQNEIRLRMLSHVRSEPPDAVIASS